MAVDALAGADAKWKNEFDAVTYRTKIDGRAVIFVKPMTVMNCSGNAVGAIERF